MPVTKRKRVVRRKPAMLKMRGAGFGDFIAGLGGGVGKGINNLLGGLFGGARKRKTRKRMSGRGDAPKAGLSLSNLNKALKDSSAISSLLSNPALGGLANTAGTVASALGYGKKRISRKRAVKTRSAGTVLIKPMAVKMRGAGVNYLMGKPSGRPLFDTTFGSSSALAF